MPKTLLLRLLRSSSTILGLIVLALASGALLIQQREYRQDVAANNFLSHAAQTSRNGIAEQLDDQLEQLGLGRTDGESRASSASDSENSETSVQFPEIESSLNQYFRNQRQQTEQTESLAPLPAAIAEYLGQHDLTAVQRFILDNPLPTWELQVATLIRNPKQTTSFFPLANLQRLLLSQGIHLHQTNPDAAAKSFEAAWRLTDAIAARPDLLSQMLAGILQQQQATLLRHIDLPGEQWQKRLERDQQQAILQALTFDQWAEYQTLQYQQTQAQAAVQSSFPWQGFVGKQYLQFSRLDWLAARKRNQSELTQQQLCETGTDAQFFPVKPNRLNAFGQGGVTVFANEWIKASDRMLAAELTQKILEAKQLARTEGQWPQQLSQLNSRVCPKLAWNYERTIDGGIRLWFDQPAHWRVGLAGDFAPLSYEAEAFQTDATAPSADS